MVCRLFADGHSDCCEVIPLCRLDLHASHNSWCFAFMNVLFVFFFCSFLPISSFHLGANVPKNLLFGLFHSVHNKLRKHFPSRKRHLRFWISIRKSLLLSESSSTFWLALHPYVHIFLNMSLFQVTTALKRPVSHSNMSEMINFFLVTHS